MRTTRGPEDPEDQVDPDDDGGDEDFPLEDPEEEQELPEDEDDGAGSDS